MSPAVRGMGEPNVKQKLRTKINNKQPTGEYSRFEFAVFCGYSVIVQLIWLAPFNNDLD